MNAEIAPVLDEIRAILKKHDMTGLIVVSNATHTDFAMEIEASWSCAWIETDAEGGMFVRIRSKLADYPSREAQHKILQDTVGNFVTLSDTLDRLRDSVKHILVMLARNVYFLGKSPRQE